MPQCPGYRAIFADQADDGLAALIFHVRQFGQVGGQRRDRLVRVHSERHADLGSRNHIDRARDAGQRPRRSRFRKPCASSMRGAATSTMVMRFFAAMALKDIPALRRARGDARSFAGGIARVQHVDRNVLLNRRQHGCRMQDLRAEVRQLRGLVEADDLDAARVRDRCADRWSSCRRRRSRSRCARRPGRRRRWPRKNLSRRVRSWS